MMIIVISAAMLYIYFGKFACKNSYSTEIRPKLLLLPQ